MAKVKAALMLHAGGEPPTTLPIEGGEKSRLLLLFVHTFSRAWAGSGGSHNHLSAPCRVAVVLGSRHGLLPRAPEPLIPLLLHYFSKYVAILPNLIYLSIINIKREELSFTLGHYSQTFYQPEMKSGMMTA